MTINPDFEENNKIAQNLIKITGYALLLLNKACLLLGLFTTK